MGTVGGSYSWNAVCDVCGFRFKANELKKRWDGLIVCADDFEHRHPMDFYRVKNDAHTLPFTRPDPEVTMYDPYYVPHADSWYTMDKVLYRTPEPPYNPGLEGYVIASTWMPTTTIQLKGIRFWVFPEQIGTNESEYQFDVWDGYTRIKTIYSIVPVRKLVAGWNYIWFNELPLLSIDKDTYIELNYFYISMQYNSHNTVMPNYVPDAPTGSYSLDVPSSNNQTPALIEKQVSYVQIGAYGEYVDLFPAASTTHLAIPFVEPIYDIVTPATNTGVLDKRHMWWDLPTPITRASAYNYGYSFTANRDLTITDVKVWVGDLTTYDCRGIIYIWDSLGNDLTLGGIDPAFTFNAANSYQWHTINLGVNTISLTAGQTYTISMYNPITVFGDGIWFGYENINYPFDSNYATFNPDLTLLRSFNGVGYVAGKRIAGAPALPTTNTDFVPLLDIVTS